MKRPLSRSKLLLANAALGLACVFLSLLAWQADPSVAEENRLLENLQALGLFLSLALSLFNLALGRRPAYISAGLSVLFLTMLLREVDVEKFDLPGLLILLGSGSGRNLLLALLWGVVLLTLVMNRRQLKEDFKTYFRSPLMGYLLAAAVFYLAGEAFDKKLLPLDKPARVFWEETAECLAALWCLLGSIAWTVSSSPGSLFKDTSEHR